MPAPAPLAPPRTARRLLSISCALLVGTLAGFVPLGAETPATAPTKPKDWPIGEYRYIGSLACKHKDANVKEDDDPCLHIGAIRVDQTPAEVEAITGKASNVVEGQAGEEIRVYSLRGASEPPPYLAVGFLGGKVSSIQLSGKTTSEPYAFSSLSLGDTTEKVTQILGPPTAKNSLKEVPGDLWSYRPFPISIEVEAGRVVSIKIWRHSPKEP